MYEHKKSPFRTPAGLALVLLLTFLALALLLAACDPVRIPVKVEQSQPAQSGQSAASIACPPVEVTCAWDWPFVPSGDLGAEPDASLAQDANPTNVTHFNNLSTTDLAVTDDLNVTDDTQVGGDATVTGALGVGGATTLGGATTINNSATITGVTSLPVNVEHVGVSSYLTAALATDTDGAAWTIADGEIWFIQALYCHVTTNFDCTGDDCTVEIGDGNDIDGLLDLDDAELQAADVDVANGPAGWQGYGSDTIGAYLAAGAGFIYAPSGESETIDIKIEDNSDQSNPTAGAAICYLIYTRFQ